MTPVHVGGGHGDETNVHYQHQYDRPWRIATFAWWVVFLLLGLFCEHTFHLLREWGQVSRLNDLVGSSLMITLAWSAFLGYFAAARCQESGMPPVEARIRGLEICILGAAAFFPFPLEALYFLRSIPAFGTQAGVVAIALVKLGAFTYLFTLLARYYLGRDTRGFMPHLSGEIPPDGACCESENPPQ